jgi:subtilisin family serine protease
MRNLLAIGSILFALVVATNSEAAYIDQELVAKLSLLGNDQATAVVVQFVGPKQKLTESRAEKIRALQEYTNEQVGKILATTSQKSSLKSLWVLPGAIVSLQKQEILALAKHEKVVSITSAEKKIVLKKGREVTPFISASSYTYGLQKIKVPELRKQYPQITGEGVRVGILDTGITPTHPDLKGKIHLFRNFSPSGDGSPSDGFGHGTHVAGTIAGGEASREAIGVAPGAKLIIGKIFSGSGESTRELILEAMQWMADPDGNPNTADYAQVVNNSWSDDEPFADRDPEQEPFCQIIKNWNALGIIGVFSAGNTGPSAGTINIPGGCPEAISVGATERNDRSPHFSSTGPAVWKSYSLMKPEISAPGFEVKSANNRGGYEEMSGTSMAAPHVTGAIALLLQAFPSKSWEEIQNILLGGADDLGQSGQDAVFGWGRANLIRSMEKGAQNSHRRN